jgi:hypothetical protein
LSTEIVSNSEEEIFLDVTRCGTGLVKTETPAEAGVPRPDDIATGVLEKM